MSASATSVKSMAERRALMKHLQKRFAGSLTVYAVLLAAGAAIVSSIASPGYPNPPVRLSGSAAAFHILGAGVSTGIVFYWVMRWIGGHAEESRILPLWLGLGLAFGISTAFLTGAVFPITAAIKFNTENFLSLGTFIDDVIDGFFKAPLSSFQYGVLALYVAAVVGVIYGVGGWLIDMLNRMAYPHQQPDPWVEIVGDWMPFTRRWAAEAAPWLAVVGPWAVAIALGGSVFLFALFGPIEFLARFRLG